MSRKNRYAIWVLFMTVAIMVLGYPVWQKTNGLRFSIPSGFYDSEQSLRISAPIGAQIYYTTDGSIPDRDSESTKKYEGEIILTDATANPNKYSMIAETSMGNMRDELELINKERVLQGLEEVDLNTACYRLPQHNIDKCNVISAVYYDIWGDRSEIYTGVYFIRFNEKEGYDDICVISLVTEPDGLFSFENGIYVLGKRYDEFVRNGENTAYFWDYWIGNFDSHGAKAEREAVMLFFDRQHNLMFQKNVGIRTQGNTSRKYNPKNLNIYSRRLYDGEESFPDIFGSGYNAERINLFMGSQDSDLKIRDACLNNLVVGNVEVGARHYIPCIMFLNGEYWGLYFLTEKYDEAFLEAYYNVNKADAVIVKNDILECGNNSDMDDYRKMRAFLKDSDLSVSENYARAAEMVDMKSTAQYYAIMTYAARFNDWPIANYEMWKSRNRGGTGFNDGKWRWMIFDLNSGSFISDMSSDWTITRIRWEDPIFDNLCKNVDFQYLFVREYLALMDTCLAYEKADALITEYASLLNDPMEVNNMRFYGSVDHTTPGYYAQDGETFAEKCNSLCMFYRERSQYVYDDLCRNFGEPLVAAIKNEIRDGE